MKNVIVRSISGIVYIGLILAAIFLGGKYFTALVALLALLGVIEFHRMTNKGISNSPLPAAIATLDAFAVLCTALLPSLELYAKTTVTQIALIGIPLYTVLRMVLAVLDTRPQAARTVAISYMSIGYIGVPLMTLNYLYTFEFAQPQMARSLVFMLFVLIWLNDTGAFCFGSTLGRHKMCPRLSPKKSWEGFWGGLFCCVVFAVIMWACTSMLDISLDAWIILAVTVSVAATFGDLFESMIKRTVGVKDSGNLIPGHGGILDRIDSLLLAAPAVMAFIALYDILPQTFAK